MPIPGELYFDSAEDVDLFVMCAQKLGLISTPNYWDWWEWYGDPSQQRRRLRWLIKPFPPTTAGSYEVCEGLVAEDVAQAACINAGLSRRTDTPTEAMRRSCRVWAGYSEYPGT